MQEARASYSNDWRKADLRGERSSRRKNSDGVGRKGEHYVDEICEDLGFRWRPQNDKNFAGDGIIEVSGKGAKSGDFIWAEVKTGPSYLSSSNETHYSIRIKKKHTDYWLGIGHRVATILVWFDPRRRIAFWTQISRETVSPGGRIVWIPKSSRFGLHSAGDLKALCAQTYRPNSRYRELHAPDLPGGLTENIKAKARRFYDKWRFEHFTAPAYGRVIISLTGWRHLTKVSRSKYDIARRLELLPAARLILASLYTRTRVRWIPETNTAYYMQTAIIKYNHRADALVSVLVKETEGQAATFASVYEHVGRR